MSASQAAANRAQTGGRTRASLQHRTSHVLPHPVTWAGVGGHACPAGRPGGAAASASCRDTRCQGSRCGQRRRTRARTGAEEAARAAAAKRRRDAHGEPYSRQRLRSVGQTGRVGVALRNRPPTRLDGTTKRHARGAEWSSQRVSLRALTASHSACDGGKETRLRAVCVVAGELSFISQRVAEQPVLPGQHCNSTPSSFWTASPSQRVRLGRFPAQPRPGWSSLWCTQTSRLSTENSTDSHRRETRRAAGHSRLGLTCVVIALTPNRQTAVGTGEGGWEGGAKRLCVSSAVLLFCCCC